jgi:hypothetical protein
MTAAGQQPTVSGLDSSLTGLSIRLRDICTEIGNLNVQIGGLGSAGIVALGTDTAHANDMVSKAAVLNTVAAVYFGKVTQATLFDFHNACSPLWAGQ